MTVFIVVCERDNLSVWSSREKAEAEIALLLKDLHGRDWFFLNNRLDIEEAEVDPDEA